MTPSSEPAPKPQPYTADELDALMSNDWFDGYMLDPDRIYDTTEHIRSLEAKVTLREKAIETLKQDLRESTDTNNALAKANQAYAQRLAKYEAPISDDELEVAYLYEASESAGLSKPWYRDTINAFIKGRRDAAGTDTP